MKEGEKEEIDIDIEIPPKILQDVLDDSRKQQADSSDCHLGDVKGDRKDKLEEYCTWTLQQVESDRWREALQAANQFAMDQFLELNSILQHPKVTAELMVKGGVKPGIALQFVSNIKKSQQEAKKP
ncbi:hypothetical protein C8A05DRAFT_46676 [Staphylotrichum tortipilum]|uniref:Uncharacterized protein n=1 Tax=Staphylotrichum tortipilum TaxID=2831512 RepID=A0AAN6MFC7_9PEZI|nr:hypothetical protein C8A05DRAFT_46676 [Staphylotrichum longicolle]